MIDCTTELRVKSSKTLQNELNDGNNERLTCSMIKIAVLAKRFPSEMYKRGFKLQQLAQTDENESISNTS